MGRVPLGRRRLLALCWRAALLAASATVAVTFAVGVVSSRQIWLYDFRHDLYAPLRDILHGHNPYRPALAAQQLVIKRLGGHPFAMPTKPPSVLLALLPFGLPPAWLGGILFVATCAGGILLALRLLGVRDWRCFALALGSYPVISGLGFGNASPLLLPGVAVMWRWRERLWAPASAFAWIVLLKIFPWVMGAWFLMRRRWRPLALAVAIALVASGLAWALIGFAGLAQYPHMISQLSAAFRGEGTSLVDFLLAIGVGAGLAQLIALALAGALLVAAWRLAGRPEQEGRAFGMVVLATLVAAPYIWEHYTLLLFAPIALVSPRLSWIWFVPVLPDAAKAGDPHSVAYVGFWVLIQGIVALRVCWPRSAGRAALRPVAAARAA